LYFQVVSFGGAGALPLPLPRPDRLLQLWAGVSRLRGQARARVAATAARGVTRLHMWQQQHVVTPGYTYGSSSTW